MRRQEINLRPLKFRQTLPVSSTNKDFSYDKPFKLIKKKLYSSNTLKSNKITEWSIQENIGETDVQSTNKKTHFLNHKQESHILCFLYRTSKTPLKLRLLKKSLSDQQNSFLNVTLLFPTVKFKYTHTHTHTYTHTEVCWLDKIQS